MEVARTGRTFRFVSDQLGNCKYSSECLSVILSVILSLPIRFAEFLSNLLCISQKQRGMRVCARVPALQMCKLETVYYFLCR